MMAYEALQHAVVMVLNDPSPHQSGLSFTFLCNRFPNRDCSRVRGCHGVCQLPLAPRPELSRPHNLAVVWASRRWWRVCGGKACLHPAGGALIGHTLLLPRFNFRHH